ncbi:hypothetical protein PENSPDRAFT_643255 [Peniophora sp. CONT]|nr:hypothetical protein PENSPDRAFT_643255 [Peniophora sp. CONT]
MAPTTRSRAAGESTKPKKRAAEYVDDATSDEEVEEKAPKRKPKKRAKTDQVAKPTAKKPATTTTRTKKRGRLNALPEMPLDILEEIFSLLDPGDLIRIARTTKAFRRLLLAGNQFSNLWRASWSRMEGYPTCPEDFSLLKWLQLLFGGPYCQVCAAPSVQRIFFSVRARMCKNCLRNTLIPVVSDCVEYIHHHHLQSYIPIVKEGRDIYAYEEDMKSLESKISSALEGVDYDARYKTIAAVTESLRDAFTPRLKHLRQCEDWQMRMIDEHRDDLGERRQKRRNDIQKRLKDLDYTNSDAYRIWKMKDVNVSKPLTDRAWNTLLPTLLPTLNQERDRRLERERRARRDSRVAAVEKGFVDLLRSGVVKARDIPYLPRATACIQFGSIPSLLDEDEDEISEDWRQRLDVALRDALSLMQDAFKKHQLEFASYIQEYAVDASECSHILSLSTSVVVVKERYGSGSVGFGLEAAALSAVQPSYYSAGAPYCDSRLPNLINPNPESLLKAVRMILGLLELEETTTILELDILDPAFACMTCPTKHDPHYHYADGRFYELHYRQVMSWRDVVHHIHDSHDKSADDLQLHLLTEGERALVGAEGTIVALKRERYRVTGRATIFACCHCVDAFIPNRVGDTYRYMSMDDVHLHVKQSHGIEAPAEGVDFFHNPLSHRGVLGGFSKEWCLVEEKGPEPEETAKTEADTNDSA